MCSFFSGTCQSLRHSFYYNLTLSLRRFKNWYRLLILAVTLHLPKGSCHLHTICISLQRNFDLHQLYVYFCWAHYLETRINCKVFSKCYQSEHLCLRTIGALAEQLKASWNSSLFDIVPMTLQGKKTFTFQNLSIFKEMGIDRCWQSSKRVRVMWWTFTSTGVMTKFYIP